MTNIDYREERIKHGMETCIHFRGLLDFSALKVVDVETCGAGVKMNDVRQAKPDGKGNLWPCFRDDGVSGHCPSVQFRTREEAAARDDERMVSLRKWVRRYRGQHLPILPAGDDAAPGWAVCLCGTMWPQAVSGTLAEEGHAMTITTLGEHPGRYLARLMARDGLSQQELARRSGINVGQICHVLHGHQGISTQMAINLAAAGLCTAYDWLCRQAEYDLAKAYARRREGAS